MKMKIITAMVCWFFCCSTYANTFNIEIDYMVSTGHSHKPSAAVINAVKAAFACQGHTLNIIVDDAIPHFNAIIRNPSNCNTSLFSYDNNTNASFGQIRQTYFNHDGQAGWYYCVFVHQYQDTSCTASGSSGLSNGGKFFIVSLGAFSGQTGTLFDKASTLMHEFGHNLGLSHCGTQNCGGNTAASDYVGPYVPNMPSTMAYQYQLAGVETNMACQGLSLPMSLYKEIDYSHGVMCSQNENALNENIGSYMTKLDWDCDGILETSVAQNINNSFSGWCGAGGNRSTSRDYNEWGNLSPGAALLSASQTGNYKDLIAADYRFVDPNNQDGIRKIAKEFIAANKMPEMLNPLLQAAQTGDANLLTPARVLTFDPNDRNQVKSFAAQVLEQRRVQNDEQPCISAEQWQVQRGQRAPCSQPSLKTESCLGGTNVYVGDLVCLPFIGCLSIGTCAFPKDTIAGAQSTYSPGSRYYLKPKTYNETNGLLLNKAGFWTCGQSGSALIK